MHIYAICPQRYHASYYYRILVPLQTMETLGLAQVLVDDLSPGMSLEDRVNLVSHSDINLFYQPTSVSLLNDMRVMNGWKQATDETGEWKCPPSFIVDTDDDLFQVHPMNPAFKDLGIRDPNGNDLPDGAEVGTIGIDGKRQVMWKDGVNGFDIARNRRTLEMFRSVAMEADAVTTTGPGALEYVERELKPKRTFVSPNMVRFDHYPEMHGVHVAKDDPSKVRILWQGSPTHMEDWYALRFQLAAILREYPQVQFVVWGVLYPWVMEMMDPSRVISVRWVPYEQYRPTLPLMGHDINLAPLMPTRFSRSRSAIRFYESSLLKHPAVTLGQSGGPYDEIIHGETGMLFSTPQEFHDHLATLIENADERKRLAENARDWVRENRDAFKLAPRLYEFYESVRKERAERTPKMTEEEMAAMKAEMAAAREKAAADKESTDAGVQPVESVVG